MTALLSRFVLFVAVVTVAVAVGGYFVAGTPNSNYPQAPEPGRTPSTLNGKNSEDITTAPAPAAGPCPANNKKETTHFCCTGNESDDCFCFAQNRLTIRTSTSFLIWVLVIAVVLLIAVSCGCTLCCRRGLRNASGDYAKE